MKKILVGLLVLGSFSAFSENVNYNDLPIKIRKQVQSVLAKCLPGYAQRATDSLNEILTTLPVGSDYSTELMDVSTVDAEAIFSKNFNGYKCFEVEPDRYRSMQSVNDIISEIAAITKIATAAKVEQPNMYATAILNDEISAEFYSYSGDVTDNEYYFILNNTDRGDGCSHEISILYQKVEMVENCD